MVIQKKIAQLRRLWKINDAFTGEKRTDAYKCVSFSVDWSMYFYSLAIWTEITLHWYVHIAYFSTIYNLSWNGLFENVTGISSNNYA